MSLDRIMTILKEKKLDALLVHDPFNMRRISGFRGGEGMLYISGQNRILITDSRYTEAAAKETKPAGFRVIEEGRKNSRFHILEELLRLDDAEVLGFEDAYLKYRDFASLQKKLNGVKSWIPLGDLIAELRWIKTEEELQALQKAEAIGDAAFSDMLEIIRPGMTELEVAYELEYAMKKEGAEGFSFATIIASGRHSSMPHAVPTEKKIEKGDLVTMDFGCIYQGHCSDMTRTISIGKADERKKSVYQVVLEAQKAALAFIREGYTGSEVDHVARKIIEDAGYGQFFGHALGHSVGLEIHERPNLSPAETTVLREGMIETVEPGIYLTGDFGIRIEDMVQVTKEGCINYTHSPKELIEL